MSNGATESLLGILPIAIAGGIAIKMTDWALDQRPRRGMLGRFKARRKPKRTPKELYFGDFRNLGYK